VCAVTGVETLGIGCIVSYVAASVVVIFAVGTLSNGAYTAVSGHRPDTWWDAYITPSGVSK